MVVNKTIQQRRMTTGRNPRLVMILMKQWMPTKKKKRRIKNQKEMTRKKIMMNNFYTKMG